MKTYVALIGILLYFCVIIAAVCGWIWNIIKIVEMGVDPLTTLLIVRIIGVFIPPVGYVAWLFLRRFKCNMQLSVKENAICVSS